MRRSDLDGPIWPKSGVVEFGVGTDFCMEILQQARASQMNVILPGIFGCMVPEWEAYVLATF